MSNSYYIDHLGWLKKNPQDWPVFKAKYLFEKVQREVREEDDVVTAFRDGEVTLRKNRRTEGFTNAVQEHGYQGVRKNDLVIHAMDAFAGAIGVSDSDGKCSPVYSICVPKKTLNPHYYAYLIRHISETGFIEALSTGIRKRSTEFRWDDFKELELFYPPFDTQNEIVRSIDIHLKEIKRLAKINEKAFGRNVGTTGLLRDYRISLISEFVLGERIRTKEQIE